jgi:hypothetical protein
VAFRDPSRQGKSQSRSVCARFTMAHIVTVDRSWMWHSDTLKL